MPDRTLIDRFMCMTLDSHVLGLPKNRKPYEYHDRFLAHLNSPTYAKDTGVGVQHWLYVIQAGKSSVVKIGIAVDVGARLEQLRNANFCELSVFNAWRVGERWETRFAERNLHRILKPYRIRREWFALQDSQMKCLHQAETIYPLNRHNPLRPFTQEEESEYLDAAVRGEFFEWAQTPWPL